ncbi:RNA polymerase II-associated protein 3 isoform X1 [Schistocerca piceifrons]|uniref:RNA polymerase II-associated protein 3 isoform X1 n=1 Tax=Schistocerca piceifrons TaxID=274613 RepID=UPI001F5EE736|nr:RNA polymerase II-associated protein 3 isoform X1 [Schistocerca piceifrons]XP_047110435.1 RNA polymerase II-associated protein 3 isoform X1 [Schistocerca piceifrons]
MDPIVLQKQIRDNAQDVQNYMLDLKNWEEEMKRKEQLLHEESADDKDATPVRSKVKRSSTGTHTETEDNRKQDKPKKIPSYDYAAWDKFDADKACELVDREMEYKVVKDHKGKISEIASEQKIKDEAYYEKEMGNKFVKQRKWTEALQCYTRAIERYSFDAIFYANRALCHLKLHNYKAGEADCTRALELDPKYVKAYLRRVTARLELNLFQEARSDLQNVLELEPSNSFAEGQLLMLDRKLAENEKKMENEEKVLHEKNSNTTVNSLSGTDENESKNLHGQNFESQNVVLPVFKPPHLRSKKPLKHIEIKEVIVNSLNEDKKEPQVVSEDNTCMNTIPRTENRGEDNIQEEKLHPQKRADDLNEGADMQLPPVPASSVQFISAWNTVKRRPGQRFHYLKQIPGDKIPSIFRESMESNMLSEIITTLVEDFLQHKAAVYPYLKGLSEVKRFGALTMFLSKNDKSGLEKLLVSCETNKECTAEEAANLRNKYEL